MLDRPIERVEALVFRYPLATPVRTSFGVMHDRPAVFIRIEDADGAAGWGETWCNFPSVGAEHRARLINEVLAPVILGHTYDSPRAAFDELSERVSVLAVQSGEHGPIAQSIAGLDIALWDLAARRAGQPLWRFLGGKDPKLPVYASGINPENPEVTAAAMRARGHRAFKLKVGFSDERDERNLAAVRAEIGPDLALCADANQAWDLETAIRLSDRLARHDLRWLEEPLRANRPWREWQELRRSTQVPLAGGENIGGYGAFVDALEQQVFEVVQPDAAKWGGVSGCLAVAHLVGASGAMYCPHYLGGGVGLLASAHLLAAAGGGGMLEVDVNENPLRDELCGPIVQVSDGSVTLTDAPGLGVLPDLRQVERFRVRSQAV